MLSLYKLASVRSSLNEHVCVCVCVYGWCWDTVSNFTPTSLSKMHCSICWGSRSLQHFTFNHSGRQPFRWHVDCTSLYPRPTVWRWNLPSRWHAWILLPRDATYTVGYSTAQYLPWQVVCLSVHLHSALRWDPLLSVFDSVCLFCVCLSVRINWK